MQRKTIVSLYWVGLGAALIVFGLMVWDHYQNGQDWLIGLIIAFVVVVLYLLLLLLLRPDDREFEVVTPRPAAAPAATSAATAAATSAGGDSGLYYDYKGDIHDVIDVEGIGPVYAERLQGAGVETTARLCYEDAAALAKRIDVPEKTVVSWQQMAELAKVNGIGKQYGEALVRAGVGGIAELKRRDAGAIADQVNAYLDTLETNVLGQKITARRVAGWKKAAAPLRKVRQAVPER